MKIALAQINPIIGAFDYNLKKIIDSVSKAERKGANLIVFPELALCGYPPEDLLLLPDFIDSITKTLDQIVEESKKISATIVVGCVRKNPSQGEKGLYNSAAVIQKGVILGFQDKILLPDYDVFSERRYFEPGGEIHLWKVEDKKVAITICEDIWQHAGAVEYSNYSRDPVEELKHLSPDLMINLSASPFYTRRHETRQAVCAASAKTLNCPLFFCNQVGSNDSLIFDGYSLAVDTQGKVFEHAKGFEEDLLIVDSQPTKSYHGLTQEPIADLFNALVLGVRDYFQKLNFKKACFGLSGGIDSAVVAAITLEALGKDNTLALLLPSRFTRPESFKDAYLLCKNLDLSCEEISIEKPFETLLETLNPYFKGRPFDTTEENLQARIRGMILMAFSNKLGYLLLCTGNKSEMGMGYATLYGDMCGGLCVLSDVTKEQVYALAHYINQKQTLIPQSIIDKPPSAELRENQKDSDNLPPYPIVDSVLQDYVEDHLSPEKIAQKNNLPLSLVKELVRKIHLNEYKRRQAPPGLRVTKKSFTVGRRFPIVQHWNMT